MRNTRERNQQTPMIDCAAVSREYICLSGVSRGNIYFLDVEKNPYVKEHIAALSSLFEKSGSLEW